MVTHRTHYRQFTIKKEPLLSLGTKLTYGFLLILTLAYLLRYFLWWIKPEHIPSNWVSSPFHALDYMLFSILTLVVFTNYVTTSAVWFAVWFMAKPRQVFAPQGLRVAFLTCYVPGKEPISMLEHTLKAMTAVRYPHDTWVLDEGDDPEVKQLCKRLDVYHFSRKHSRRFNGLKGAFRKRTKAGNHNAWRHHHENAYDFIAQIDMDHIPIPEFLDKTLGYFRDPNVAIVGSPETYQKTGNWFVQGSSEQSALFHYVMQPGYYGSDMPFLIGTSHIYRVSALNSIGGYAPTIVEDHLTGIRLYAKGYKGVFVPEILAEGHGPLNWVDYFNQQLRWSYGLFEIFFTHTPRLIWRLTSRQKINYFLAELYYFSGVAVSLGALITIIYLWFGIQPTNMQLVEWLWYATPVFIASQVLQFFILRLGTHPERIPLFGLKGKLLGLGANIIYMVAFISFFTRRKFSYAVTKKNTDDTVQSVPFRTFSLHVSLFILSMSGLIASQIEQHTSLMLRVWAAFTVIITLLVIMTNYFPHISTFIKRLRKTMRLAGRGELSAASLQIRHP